MGTGYRVGLTGGIASGKTSVAYLFAALGDDLGQGRWSLRLQYKPLIRYVWLGAIFIALGGAIAAFDRRYRVRAPAAAAERVAAAAS